MAVAANAKSFVRTRIALSPFKNVSDAIDMIVMVTEVR
jgi:hypothetical protein